MTGDHLRAVPPKGSSVNDMEIAITKAILQTAERVAPLREQRLPESEGMEDDKAEAHISVQ